MVVVVVVGGGVVVVGGVVVPEPDPLPELDSHVQGSGVPVNGPQVFISGI